MLYAGIDVHKKECYVVVMTKDGEIVKEEEIKTDEQEIRKCFEDLNREFKVTLEATTNYRFVYDILEEIAEDVLLSDPRKNRLIAEEMVKTDKVDARALADLLRGNLLATSYVPEKEILKLRDVCRRRHNLGRKRGDIKNQIKTELRKRNIDYSDRSIFTKKGIDWLESLGIDALSYFLPIYKELDKQCSKLEDEIAEKGKEYEEVRLLTSIPGVAIYSASLIFAEIADISRFPSEEKLYSYAGVVPTVHQSGESSHHGRITKTGNKYLRNILLQNVQSHRRWCPESNISKYYDRKLKEKDENDAKIFAARKLLQAIYWMLENQDEFRVGG